jgi:hypothetical protein
VKGIKPKAYAIFPKYTSLFPSRLTWSPITNIEENAQSAITIYNTILIDFVLVNDVNVRIIDITVAIRQIMNKSHPNV